MWRDCHFGATVKNMKSAYTGLELKSSKLPQCMDTPTGFGDAQSPNNETVHKSIRLSPLVRRICTTPAARDPSYVSNCIIIIEFLYMHTRQYRYE